MKLGKEVQDTRLTDQLVAGLKEIVPLLLGTRKSGRDSFISESPELAILTERLLPAALDLAAGDDADLTVNVEDE